MATVFSNPPHHKRHRKMSPYNRFVKSYLHKHKGAGMSAAAKAWSCHRCKRKGGKLSRRVRRHAGRKGFHAIRHLLKRIRHGAHKVMRRHGKHRGPTSWSIAAKIEGGHYSSAAGRKRLESMLKHAKKREAFSDRMKAARHAKKADMYGELSAVRSSGGYNWTDNPFRRHHMRRHRSHRYNYRHRRHGHGLFSMNPPSHAHGHAGYLSGLRPANLKGAVPVFIGAIANGMLRKMIASKSGVGALQSGIGSYVLAFGTAGLVGALGGMLNPRIGQSAMLGAVVEALSGVFGDVAGKVGLSNYGIDGEFRGGVMDGMDDFAVPGQIKNAYVSDPGMTQYPMPMNSSSAFGAAVPAPAYPATAGSFANNPPASAEAMALSGMDANDYLEAF